ncbi:MAG: Fic family protein [Pseudobutyrivibrio sp.]|nr:Fic family protein [Pseudobutyrivibrio sp.]
MERNKPYQASKLEKDNSYVEINNVLPNLLKAYSKLEVYKAKMKDSKVDTRLLIPVMQAKEAKSSAAIEGTQATLEDVFESQVQENNNSELKELLNCIEGLEYGYVYLQRETITEELFNNLQKKLLSGRVHRDSVNLGAYRKKQNQVTNKKTGQVMYTPPKPSDVEGLMNNLIEYIDYDCEEYWELVRIAIIHAQFETIHPYSDGNGRVGRLLIPLYLYYKKVIDTPYFFVSEILESNRAKYYSFLNSQRETGEWEEWVIFFLESITQQCEKYINMVDNINVLYAKDYDLFVKLIKPERAKIILELLFRHPVIDANTIMKKMDLSRNTVLRYLQALEENGRIFSDGKERYTKYYYYDLISLLDG